MNTSLLPALAVLALAAPTVASAQLLAAKDAPVVYGHYHLHVTSAAEHRRFWIDALGGRGMQVGPLEAVAYPNVFVFLQQAKPADSKGTTIDHIAFQVTDLKSLVDRLRSASYRLTTQSDVNAMYTVTGDIADMPDRRQIVAFVEGPDGVRVELIERRGGAPQTQRAIPPPGIALDHVHLTLTDFTAMRQWYMKTFGATIGSQTFESKEVDLPGLPGVLHFSRPNREAFSLTGTPAPFSPQAGVMPASGSKGRVVDHIGFEVRGLEAFVKKLEESGMKLDVPYRQVPAVGLNIAFITDPWGTSIELTEGLSALK
jgi:catechol 2,3-dioxygenase-like lactoylglutathione lyase family enzyme